MSGPDTATSSNADAPQATSWPVPLGAGASCDARLYRQPTKDAPLVLYLHGGAFTAAPAADVPCVGRMLYAAGATIIALDYPLAPEHPFPQAIDAAYAALMHLHRQRRRLWGGRDPRLFVAGEEAGGNLAAAVAMMARDRGEPMLAGQILFSPMLDVCVATASLRDAHAGPVGCRWADGWRKYLPRASDALHPYATPGAAVRLAGLPPTLLVTAQDDPMRDEAEAYARRLRGESVPVAELRLPLTTGFPVSYLKPMPCEAAWIAPVHDALQRFLAGDTANESLSASTNQSRRTSP